MKKLDNCLHQGTRLALVRFPLNMASAAAEHDLTLSEADSSKEKGQVFGILRLQEEKSGAGDKANSSSSTGRSGGGGGGGVGDGRWQAPIFALARKASETISGSIHVLPKVSEHRTSLPGDWAVQGTVGYALFECDK